jgi:hypothetical protein
VVLIIKIEVILDLDIMKIYNDSELKRNYTSLGRNGYIMFCRVCVFSGIAEGA